MKSNPEDLSFASYLHSLEQAGVTKEQMIAMGLLTKENIEAQRKTK